jgi:phage tail-like protein
MTDDFNMPVAFHFSVSLEGAGIFETDAAFREVSGLETEIATEEVREGGENTFVHQLPNGRRQGMLKLQRGLATGDDQLMAWCKQVLESPLNSEIKTATLLVKLLDAEQSPVAMWSVQNCWPVKWQIGGFDAMKNALAVETIELSYTTINRVTW